LHRHGPSVFPVAFEFMQPKRRNLHILNDFRLIELGGNKSKPAGVFCLNSSPCLVILKI
jgi:hypothetical protein